MSSMRIPLTQGKYATIDAADYGRVARFKWCAHRSRGLWYARRGAGGREVKMHRFILNAPPAVEVDHVNGDGLDNRRENLRLVTHAQNSANQRRPKNNTSGFKGVYRLQGHWAASVSGTYLGLFDTPEEAAHAYDTRAREVFGAFANLNFPEETIAIASRVGAPLRSSTSGYRGVSFRKAENKWVARLTHAGTRLFLGSFGSAEEAAAAYNAKARELRDH